MEGGRQSAWRVLSVAGRQRRSVVADRQHGRGGTTRHPKVN